MALKWRQWMASEPHLTEATITFTPSRDATKEAGAALSVYVTTRVLNALNIMMASDDHVAVSDHWTGADATKYDYPLQTTPVLLSELTSDIDVRLEWAPSSPATACAFSYDLSLSFSSDSNSTTVLNHHVDGITLNEFIRSQHDSIGLAAARALLDAPPTTDPELR
jgi:hypothetical protein